MRHLPLAEMARRVLPLFRPHRTSLAAGLLLVLLSVVCELGGPVVLRHLIDEGIARRSGGGILESALLYAGLFVLGTIATYFQVIVLTRMGLSIVTQLKKTMFSHILGLGLDFFDRNAPGRLLARVESDTERLQMLFSEVAVALLRTVVLFAGAVAVLFLTRAGVTLAILLFATPIFVGTLFYFRWMRSIHRRSRRQHARISAFLSEYVQGVPILQSYGYEDEARRRLAELNADKVRTDRRAAAFEYGYWALLSAVEVVAILLLLYVGTGRAFGAALSVGTLILFVEYTRRIFAPLAMFSEQIGFVQRAFASADRVFGVLDTPSRTPDVADARDEVPDDWAAVAFEDVSFAYDGKAPAINGLSFTVRRGERVALVGLSGGGKTTIANLLLRYYEPTGGRIAIDGVDLRRFRLRAWRRRVGLVLQEIHLFPGTVGENLRALADGVPQDDVDRAARTVGADEVIARLPRGQDEPLAEGGANLSMGERQLLSFARALVHDPDLLILDEATSSVDPGTERRLQESMERLLAGRTAVVIAHRLATVLSADRILVIHGGRIVEEGPHAELHARRGLYRDLFELQFAGGSGA